TPSGSLHDPSSAGSWAGGSPRPPRRASRWLQRLPWPPPPRTSCFPPRFPPSRLHRRLARRAERHTPAASAWDGAWRPSSAGRRPAVNHACRDRGGDSSRPGSMPRRLPLFATAARGTEDLLADELTELGATRGRADRGGVRFLANLHEALRIAVWSRIAMRLLWPLAEAEVHGAEGLYDAAHEVPWEEHLDPGATFAVEATLRDSEHSHSGFVALKIKDALVDRLRKRRGGRPDVDTRRPDVRVLAHLAGTRLSLSLDVAGAPLNRRGYRVRPTVAPLKETLAAAILRAVRYTRDEPLVDPMCGSGTFLVEAGLIAVHRAPGARRTFGIERWPSLEAEARASLDRIRAEARAGERRAPFLIRGFDRSAEAVEAARANIGAARLEREVSLTEADATGPLPPSALRPA